MLYFHFVHSCEILNTIDECYTKPNYLKHSIMHSNDIYRCTICNDTNHTVNNKIPPQNQLIVTFIVSNVCSRIVATYWQPMKSISLVILNDDIEAMRWQMKIFTKNDFNSKYSVYYHCMYRWTLISWMCVFSFILPKSKRNTENNKHTVFK